MHPAVFAATVGGEDLDRAPRLGYPPSMKDPEPMPAKETSRPAGRGEADRAARLKAALKANISRRKAQARARGDASADAPTGPEG